MQLVKEIQKQYPNYYLAIPEDLINDVCAREARRILKLFEEIKINELEKSKNFNPKEITNALLMEIKKKLEPYPREKFE